MRRYLIFQVALAFCAVAAPVSAQEDGCNAVGNLETLNGDVTALRNMAPTIRQERATELLGHTGFMRDALNQQGGSVVFGMNQGVMEEFVSDRERILKSVAGGDWDTVQSEIGSERFHQQAARLAVIQDALRCNSDDEEQKEEDKEKEEAAKKEEEEKKAEELKKKAAARQLGPLQALSALGGGMTGSDNTLIQAAILFLLTLPVAAILFFGGRVLRRVWRNTGRKYQRYYCTMEGELSCPQKSRPVTVVEVSRSGAKLASDDLPEPGTAVTLRMPDHKIKARVVWSNANYAGVAFDKLISIRVEDFRAEDKVPDDPPEGSELDAENAAPQAQ